MLDQEYANLFQEVPVLQLLRDNPCLVDRVILGEDKPIGLLIFTPSYKETEIVRVSIDRDYWGLGIGSKLIEQFAEDQKHHRDRIFVNIPDKNTRAQRFFSKVGFKPTPVGAIKVVDGRSYILMERIIDRSLSVKSKNPDIRYGG
jgi:ribosomal protein S18 acetylase RimI-like enzyme